MEVYRRSERYLGRRQGKLHRFGDILVDFEWDRMKSADQHGLYRKTGQLVWEVVVGDEIEDVGRS